MTKELHLLGWNDSASRKYYCMATVTKKKFLNATGAGADFIHNNIPAGHIRDIVMANPEKLYCVKRTGMTLNSEEIQNIRCVPEEEWSYRYREDLKKAANSISAGETKYLVGLYNKIDGKSPKGTKLLDIFLINKEGKLTEKGENLARAIIDQGKQDKSLYVDAVLQVEARKQRHLDEIVIQDTRAKIKAVRNEIVEMAQKIARQSGSLDELIVLVDKLEKLEA